MNESVRMDEKVLKEGDITYLDFPVFFVCKSRQSVSSANSLGCVAKKRSRFFFKKKTFDTTAKMSRFLFSLSFNGVMSRKITFVLHGNRIHIRGTDY